MKHLLFSLLLIGVFSCSAQNSSTKLSADEFEKAIDSQKVQLLDVRTSKEFSSGHIKDAMQADWTNADQFKERIKYVDKDKPVYVYCLAGGRSAAAAAWMKEHGFSNIIELQGGINAWKTANKPLEGAEAVSQWTEQDYWAQIPKDKTVLVDFGASWCPPCVKMEPVLKEVIKEQGDKINFVKVDGGVHLNVMKALGVDALPVLIVYKNGKEVWRKQGIADKKEILAALN